MNDQDLESRVRSYYRTLDATDSSRLVSTSQVLLEDARRPRPRRLIWGSWRLAGSIAGAALLAAVLVLPRLAGPGGSVGSVGSAGSVAATGSPIPTPNPSVAATIAGPAPASPAATPLDAAGAVAAVEKFLGRKLGPTQTTEPGVMAIGRVIQVTESLPPDGAFPRTWMWTAAESFRS